MDNSKILLIQSLDSIRPDDIEAHGGKATNLARLRQEGFRTPNGFSISSHSFAQMRDGIPDVIGLLDRLQSTSDFEEVLLLAEKLQTLVGFCQLDEDLKSEITDELQRMQGLKNDAEAGYAVRSSATIEDRSDISFAGQAETLLCIRGTSDVFEAVKQVWKSTYSPSAAIYLKSKGIPLKHVRMAVVIQEMVPAVVSGVMFTANVVNNNTNEMLINATWGLGETLVSGRVIPDTFILSKKPRRVLQRELGTKMITSVASVSKNSTKATTHDTPREKREEFTLDNPLVLKVAQIGLEIEQMMGTPQDIEWCVKSDGEIVILQSRPITTLSIP